MNAHSEPWHPSAVTPHGGYSHRHAHNPYRSAHAETPEPLVMPDEADSGSYLYDHDSCTTPYTPLDDWTVRVERPQTQHSRANAVETEEQALEETTHASGGYAPYRSDPETYMLSPAAHEASAYSGPYRSPALREPHELSDDVYNFSGAFGSYGYGAYVSAAAAATTPPLSGTTAPAGRNRKATKTPSKPTKGPSATQSRPAAAATSRPAHVSSSTSATLAATPTPLTFTLPKPKSAQMRAPPEATAAHAVTSETEPSSAVRTPDDPTTSDVTTAEAEATALSSRVGQGPRSYRSAVLKDVRKPSTAPNAADALRAATPSAPVTKPTAAASPSVPLPRSLRTAAAGVSIPAAAPIDSEVAAIVCSTAAHASPPPPTRGTRTAQDTAAKAPTSPLHELYARLQTRPNLSVTPQATTDAAASGPVEEGRIVLGALSPTPLCCSTATIARSSLTKATPRSSNQLTSSLSGGSESERAQSMTGDAPDEGNIVSCEVVARASGDRVKPSRNSSSKTLPRGADNALQTAQSKKEARSTAKNGGWVEVKGSNKGHSKSAQTRRTTGSAAASSTPSAGLRLCTPSVFSILTGSATATTASPIPEIKQHTTRTAAGAAWEPPRARPTTAAARRTEAHAPPSKKGGRSAKYRRDNGAVPDSDDDVEALLAEMASAAHGTSSTRLTSSATVATATDAMPPVTSEETATQQHQQKPSGTILILGIPLHCGATPEDWLDASCTAAASVPVASATAKGGTHAVPGSVSAVWSLLRRSLAVREESASAKLHLLERALDHVFANSPWALYTSASFTASELTADAHDDLYPFNTPSTAPSPGVNTNRVSTSVAPAALSVAAMAHHIHQRGFPLQLICAVLVEASDCCADLDQSLRYAQDARDVAIFAQVQLCGAGDTQPTEKEAQDERKMPCSPALNRFRVVEALGRLAITRALVRVIDVTGAKEQLLCAAGIALDAVEAPLLGWIALQLGITLELSGFFAQALRVYTTAHALANLTGQPRLLCDVLCCQSIARSAVGDDEHAHALHEASVRVLTHRLPRASHARPLQNMVQLKLQMGDMASALTMHQAELALAREQHDMASVARCYGSIALAERYMRHYEAAAQAHMEELAAQRGGDPRQLVECWTGAASCLLLAGQTARARGLSNKAMRYVPRAPSHTSAAEGTAQASRDASSTTSSTNSTVKAAATSVNHHHKRSGDESGAVVRDYCTIAKTWVERADILLQLGDLDEAESLVFAALEAMASVTATERGHYLITATMCELDWRCCCVLQRVYFARGGAPPQRTGGAAEPYVWYALQLSEACNTPNTTHARDLLERRARQYALPVPLFHTHATRADAETNDAPAPAACAAPPSAPWLRSCYLAQSLVTAEAVLEVLKRPDFRRRKVVLYALPWTENSLAMAYVLSLAPLPQSADAQTGAHEAEQDTNPTSHRTAASQLHVEAVPLSVDEEMTSLLVSATSALACLFDAPLRTWASSAATADLPDDHNVVYGDTPLWPQHYSSTAFRFAHQRPSPEDEKKEGDADNACACAALRFKEDPMYCLTKLYDCLVRPLEGLLFAQETHAGRDVTKGITVVGDGIFTRLPFHALYDGRHFLTEKLDVTTCASLALLCVLHAADACAATTADAATTVNDVQQPHLSSNEGNVDPQPIVRARVLDVAAAHTQVRSHSVSRHLAALDPAHVSMVVTTVDEAAHALTHTQGEQHQHGADDSVEMPVCTSTSSSEEAVPILAPFYAMCAELQTTTPSTDSATTLDEQTVLAAMSALVKDQYAFGKDTPASNRLYLAVHNLDGAMAEPATPQAKSPSRARSLLELHLPVLPEVREDFCGAFVSTDAHKRLAHAFELSHLWNVQAYDLVLCEGCGTYSGFSIHESGVPVYRALQYAGATRLVLPIGSRTPLYAPAHATAHTEGDRAVLKSAVEAAMCGGESFSAALQKARCQAIQRGVPLAQWATYTLCGLP